MSSEGQTNGDCSKHATGLHRLSDSLVCLAVIVIVFRAFVLEGYIVSSGSMAPGLLGYHKQLVCPTCRFPFVFGVRHDKPAPPKQTVVCPNCGQSSIRIGDVPRNEGDQLLIHKNAFQFRRVQRWEIVVFRNLLEPRQAFVKRVLGLPGERIQLIDGDVHINGKLQRKKIDQQRALRILVFDHDYQPRNDPAWQPQWIAQRGWHATSNGFESRVIQEDELPDAAYEWVSYRHWIRFGGSHFTTVPIAEWPSGVDQPNSMFATFYYDQSRRRLVCAGVLPVEIRDRWLATSNDVGLRQAVLQLSAQSHFAPITDTYGYNSVRRRSEPKPVRDLMLSLQLEMKSDHGQYRMQMRYGHRQYNFTIDMDRKELNLSEEGVADSGWTTPLPEALRNKKCALEMSLFDRQVLITVAGETIEKPLIISETPIVDVVSAESAAGHQRKPQAAIRFGTCGGMHAVVDSIKVYRDVSYRDDLARHAVKTPYQLGEDEHFFLGDNSPVSLDSRRWPKAGVTSQMFLGKPLVVHLPSRPGRIQIYGFETHVRIPDFSRIRYIR